MLALPIFSASATLGAGAVPVRAWAAGVAATASGGAPLLAPHGLAREGGAVRMPGSRVPTGLMLGIVLTTLSLGVAV